jgi:hypothetical protein
MTYAPYWDFKLRRIAVYYRRFGRTYRFIFSSVHAVQEECWPLKMGPICCPETSLGNYQSTLRQIQNKPRSLSERLGKIPHKWEKINIFKKIISLIDFVNWRHEFYKSYLHITALLHGYEKWSICCTVESNRNVYCVYDNYRLKYSYSKSGGSSALAGI